MISGHLQLAIDYLAQLRRGVVLENGQLIDHFHVCQQLLTHKGLVEIHTLVFGELFLGAFQAALAEFLLDGDPIDLSAGSAGINFHVGSRTSTGATSAAGLHFDCACLHLDTSTRSCRLFTFAAFATRSSRWPIGAWPVEFRSISGGSCMVGVIDQVAGKLGNLLAAGRVFFHHLGRKLLGGVRLQAFLSKRGDGNLILARAMNTKRKLLVAAGSLPGRADVHIHLARRGTSVATVAASLGIVVRPGSRRAARCGRLILGASILGEGDARQTEHGN
jgi:hypothetical protein